MKSSTIRIMLQNNNQIATVTIYGKAYKIEVKDLSNFKNPIIIYFPLTGSTIESSSGTFEEQKNDQFLDYIDITMSTWLSNTKLKELEDKYEKSELDIFIVAEF